MMIAMIEGVPSYDDYDIWTKSMTDVAIHIIPFCRSSVCRYTEY